MARFRKMKRYTKRMSAGYRKAGRSTGSTNVLNMAIAGAIYAAGRPYIANYIPSSVSNFANGNGDELLLGGVGYLLAKGKIINKPFAKDLGKSILVIESARISSGLINSMQTARTSSSTQTWGDY